MNNTDMKSIYIKYMTAFVMVALIISGCTSQLDKFPPQSVKTEVALSTDENVKFTLVGGYDALSNSDLFGGKILRNSELLAADGEIRFTGTFEQPGEIWNKQITTTNSDVAEVWLDGYNTINIANNVLSALDVVNEADRDLVEGEALFLRGLVYFELVKFFGKPYSDGNASSNLGVPIVLTPTTVLDDTYYVSRNTVQEVYLQVIADLQSAVSKLPVSNDVYANSVATNAVLSRVYLQMGDYSNALTTANTAINDASGYYSLAPTYDAVFNNESNGVEDIFSIQVTTQDGTNDMQLYYSSNAYGGRGDIDFLPAHFAYYNPADERLNLFYVDPSDGKDRTGKWENQFANVTTIRLAELYLTRAECNVRLGSSVGDTPANDLFRIRNRVGLGFIPAPTLTDVLRERKLELAQEGQAIHDFKRTQGLFYALPDFNGTPGDGLVDGFAYDDDKLVYPIPDREINVNPNLVQNPGYSN